MQVALAIILNNTRKSSREIMKNIFTYITKPLAAMALFAPAMASSQSDTMVDLEVSGIHIEKWEDGSYRRIQESDVKKGDTVYLVADLKNTGNQTSPTFNVAWHLLRSEVDTLSGIMPAATMFKGYGGHSELSPGATSTGNVRFKVSEMPDLLEMQFQADLYKPDTEGTGKIKESSESNNTSSIIINTRDNHSGGPAEEVDLEVSGFDVQKWDGSGYVTIDPSEINKGDTFYVLAKLKNNGSADSRGFNIEWNNLSYMTFYPSMNACTFSTDTPARGYHKPLKAQTLSNGNVRFKINNAKDYQSITYKADYDNNIKETNESNNEARFELSINGVSPANCSPIKTGSNITVKVNAKSTACIDGECAKMDVYADTVKLNEEPIETTEQNQYYKFKIDADEFDIKSDSVSVEFANDLVKNNIDRNLKVNQVEVYREGVAPIHKQTYRPYDAVYYNNNSGFLNAYKSTGTMYWGGKVKLQNPDNRAGYNMQVYLRSDCYHGCALSNVYAGNRNLTPISLETTENTQIFTITDIPGEYFINAPVKVEFTNDKWNGNLRENRNLIVEKVRVLDADSLVKEYTPPKAVWYSGDQNILNFFKRTGSMNWQGIVEFPAFIMT